MNRWCQIALAVAAASIVEDAFDSMRLAELAQQLEQTVPPTMNTTMDSVVTTRDFLFARYAMDGMEISAIA